VSSKKESVSRTFIVAFLISLVCSIVVSASVIFLKPIQKRNNALNLKKNILLIAGMAKEGISPAEIERKFKHIQAKIVDLKTGEYVSADTVGKANVSDYVGFKAAKNPKYSKQLTSSEDIAKIKREEEYSKVFLVKKDGKLQTIILPIRGYGLWSTLYGYIALKADANTIVGLGFYDQLETPGLGGEVDNPRWKALWPGKKVYDLSKSNTPLIKLVKGGVDPKSKDAVYGVDALSGASMTSRGVTNLLRFWLGKEGFQKYLIKLRAGEV
jgi:Na+-transporting NADH:ubiquinone oxidoreductase subunit C